MHIIPLTKDLLATNFDSYLVTLATLSPVGEHTSSSLLACFDRIQNQGTAIFVAFDDERQQIIGTISVLIENKFNRGGSRVAHIEDIAVHPDAQGKGVGKALMQQAISYAQEQRCYKIILDADKDPNHVDYYKTFGFNHAGAFMKMSLD